MQDASGAAEAPAEALAEAADVLDALLTGSRLGLAVGCSRLALLKPP